VEVFHVADEGIDEVVRVLFDVNELEVKTAALVGQLGEVKAKESALASVQLGIPLHLYGQHGLLPKFAV